MLISLEQLVAIAIERTTSYLVLQLHGQLVRALEEKSETVKQKQHAKAKDYDQSLEPS